jgi:hypothetical protein
MEMNNKPVAVYINKDDGLVCAKCCNPLYTHPAELTDKEIKDIWCEVYNFKGYDCLTELDYKFCREMIRKAQEK